MVNQINKCRTVRSFKCSCDVSVFGCASHLFSLFWLILLWFDVHLRLFLSVYYRDWVCVLLLLCAFCMCYVFPWLDVIVCPACLLFLSVCLCILMWPCVFVVVELCVGWVCIHARLSMTVGVCVPLTECSGFQKKKQRELKQSWARWTACFQGQPITAVRLEKHLNRLITQFTVAIFSAFSRFVWLIAFATVILWSSKLKSFHSHFRLWIRNVKHQSITWLLSVINPL